MSMASDRLLMIPVKVSLGYEPELSKSKVIGDISPGSSSPLTPALDNS